MPPISGTRQATSNAFVIGESRHDLAPQPSFQVMEIMAFMKTTHGPNKIHGQPRTEKFPPHRRQGRLVAAGQFRRRRSAVCVPACGAGRRPCHVVGEKPRTL